MLSFNETIKKICKERTTLQVHPFIIQNGISDSDSYSSKRRKVSFFASFTRSLTKKKVRGFFTLEATVVLPVFIFVMCAFFWYFVVFKTQMEVWDALRDVSKDLSEYAFLYEEVRNFSNDASDYVRLQDRGLERWLVGGITEVYVENEIKKQIGRDSSIWKYIEGGEDGIELKSFLRVPDEDGMIDLILVYEMKNPFLPGAMGTTEYVQRSRVRAWTGYSYREEGKEEDDVEVVYVTEYGEVYHTTRNCTHLDLSIKSMTYVSTYVVYGDKVYTECEICEADNTSIIYVTDTGSRYHWSTACRSLKRTIYEIPKAEATEYTPCSRCGKDAKSD